MGIIRYRLASITVAIVTAFAVTPPAFGASRTVHVFVALADNANQGIVPVPAKLGNGADAEHNLYWGAAGGVKTFFVRSGDWRLILDQHLKDQRLTQPEVLERVVFKHRTADVYLIADAYRGDRIERAIMDFLAAAGGGNGKTIAVQPGQSITSGGGSDLVAYIGHDGLMDFRLRSTPRQAGPGQRQVVVLACISKSYFREPVRATGADPLLWTTGLMAPEAYTLKSALDGWINGETREQIRERAAAAYDHYQKCGIKAARRLLVSGW